MQQVNRSKQDTSKTARLLKNTGILAIGGFSSKILVFLLVPFYTAFLTTEEYGSYDIIYNTVSLMAPILTLNISEALLRFPMEKDADISRIARIGLTLTIVSVIPVVVVQLIPDTPWGSIAGISWLAALYASFTLYQSLTLLARGLERMMDIAIAGIASAIILVVLNVVFLLFFECGLDGFFAANVASLALPAFWLLWRMRTEVFAPVRKTQTGLLSQMVKYSLPLATATIGWWLIGTSDRYIVLAFCGMEANGLYSIAYRIPSVISTVASIFIQAWQVSAVKEFDPKDTDGFLRKTYASIESLIVLLCSVLILLSPVIAIIMFSGDFYEAWVYVPLLLVYAALNAMGGMWAPFFSASYASATMAYSTLLAGVVNIILAIPLVIVFGVQGACLSSVLAGLANWGFRAIRVRRYVEVDFGIRHSLFLYAVLTVQALTMCTNLLTITVLIIEVICAVLLLFACRREIHYGVEAFVGKIKGKKM